MKLRQTVNILLIALFVWAFQSSTIHFQHQEIDEISECNLCHTAEQLELYQHSTPLVVFNESFAVKVREEAQRIVVQSRYDYTDVAQFKCVKSVLNTEFTVKSIPLGYHATAPPLFFPNI